MKKLCLLVILALALPAAAQTPPPAGPDPAEKESLEQYQKGVTAYDLGKFDEAVTSFQKAYEIKPTPAYLYNIAQAYRQKGDAAKAVFFYKRYLQKAPDAKNRDVVEKRIGELEELAKKQEESKAKPPNSLEGEKGEPPPADNGKTTTAMVTPPPPDAGPPASSETAVSATATKQSVARLALEAGTAFVNMGDGPSVPVQVSVRVGGAYTLHLGGTALDLGATGTVVPVPFETLDRTANGTALMLGILANVGLRYPVATGFELRGELGGGVVLMTGLREQNPFTKDGKKAGAAAMPSVRVAAGLDYAVAGDLRLTLTPAFAWSAASGKFDDRISSILRVDVLLGVAYTL